jgi:5-methylcytosine-specific restriction protein A
MQNHYIPNQTVPDFDHQIDKLIDTNGFDGGGNTMLLAIENRLGEVYRIVSVTGLSEYMGAVYALIDLGFVDLLADAPASKEGYDSRMRPLNVKLEPLPEPAKEWHDSELEAAVDAYLWMLDQESHGKPYNKSDVNAKLREKSLSGRTKGSIEFRMQNISATLDELCLPRISGYLPAKNVGEGVKDRIRSVLAKKGVFSTEDYESSSEDTVIWQKVRKLRQRKLTGVPRGSVNPTRMVSSAGFKFVRDPLVIASVLDGAMGACEGCKQPAPFEDGNGFPFLEVHHVLPLALGGSDRVSNAVALCPNCHRRCHHAKDRDAFTASLYQSVTRLIFEKRASQKQEEVGMAAPI